MIPFPLQKSETWFYWNSLPIPVLFLEIEEHSTILCLTKTICLYVYSIIFMYIARTLCIPTHIWLYTHTHFHIKVRVLWGTYCMRCGDFCVLFVFFIDGKVLNEYFFSKSIYENTWSCTVSSSQNFILLRTYLPIIKSILVCTYYIYHTYKNTCIGSEFCI